MSFNPVARATHSSEARKDPELLALSNALRLASTSDTIPRSMGRERPISVPSVSTWMYLHPDVGRMEPPWPPRNIPVRAPRRMIKSGGDFPSAGR